MSYNGKMMLAVVSVLTLTFGIALATTTIPQYVFAQQNMTTGNNATGGGNMTDTEQSGNISGIAIDEKGKPALKPGK